MSRLIYKKNSARNAASAIRYQANGARPCCRSSLTKTRTDIAEVIAGSDVLVVGLGGAGIATALAQHTRPDQTIVDLINIADRTALRGEYVGLCW